MFPRGIIFCTNILSLQAEIISTSIVALASPLFSITRFFFHQTPPSKNDDHKFELAAPIANSREDGSSQLLRRIAVGLLAAAYVCIVLMVAMAVAAVLGVGLVRAWAEKPVYARADLQFDYAEAHPTAVFYFGDEAAADVPVGHTLYVSLLLLMPESDYNRDLGIFQMTTEVISPEGDSVAKTSKPCMLRFRSWPIRLTRTILVGVPLLLGLTSETQTITFHVLKHKESRYPRTKYIRITLIPRAGTISLPQFYNAEVVVKSRPPWTKEFVYRWKWTFYVWTALYIFAFLVVILVLFLRPLIFPVMAALPFPEYGQESAAGEERTCPESLASRPRDEGEVSETVKRWQRSRSRRTAALLRGKSDSVGPRASATSFSLTQAETGAGSEEGSGDSSESVCFKREG